MKKGFRWMLALVLALCVFAVGAVAEEESALPVLTSAFFQNAEFLDQAESGRNYLEHLLYDDGMLYLTLVREVAPTDGTERTIADMAADYVGELYDAEPRDVEPIASYPAERIFAVTGANEDTSAVEAVLIRTDTMNFFFAAQVGMDFYDDEAATIDELIGSLDLFDATEWAEKEMGQNLIDDPNEGLGDVIPDEEGAEDGQDDLPDNVGDFDENPNEGRGDLIPPEDGVIETEFYTLQVPEDWAGLYNLDVYYYQPSGYLLMFMDGDSGDLFFALDAIWIDEQPINLAEGDLRLGIIDVERLGSLELVAHYGAECALSDGVSELLDSLTMADGCTLTE